MRVICGYWVITSSNMCGLGLVQCDSIPNQILEGFMEHSGPRVQNGLEGIIKPRQTAPQVHCSQTYMYFASVKTRNIHPERADLLEGYEK